jgi:hypothetical protein
VRIVSSIQRNNDRGPSTACPSGLLFLPPEKDVMYGFPEAASTQLSFKASIRWHAFST